jgi:polyisoprenoid-binding protein YceI
MAESSWSLTPADGELHILTSVDGRAAKMGHRLTIALNSWQGTVRWSGEEPASGELTVDVDSLEVLHGEGGLTPFTGAEKGVCRSNALKSLDTKKFPQIRFSAERITRTAGGYRLDGTVDIHGTSRPQSVDVTVTDVGDALALSAQVAVKQTDFGVKPFSLMMGALKVADEVTLAFSAKHAK